MDYHVSLSSNSTHIIELEEILPPLFSDKEKPKSRIMGSSQTKYKSTPSENAVTGLKNKIKLLRGRINEIMAIMEIQSRVYEEQLIAFAVKQEKWKREKRRLKEETKKLRMRFEEEERLSKNCMDKNVGTMDLNQKCDLNVEWEIWKRDEPSEKWKELYFAIKVELDELIQRTQRGERLCWGRKEEEIPEYHKKELIAKEERIESLEAKLASMENQEIKKQREVDILRQSLRIMSHGKKLNKIGQTGYWGKSDCLM